MKCGHASGVTYSGCMKCDLDQQAELIKKLEAQLAQEKKYDIEKQRDIWAEYCKKAWTERDIAWEQIKELEAKLDAVKGLLGELEARELAQYPEHEVSLAWLVIKLGEAIGEQSDE